MLLAAGGVIAYTALMSLPPGLDGDRYMARSLWLGLLGMPTSAALAESLRDTRSTAVFYFAVFAPILLNGILAGGVVGGVAGAAVGVVGASAFELE